MGQLDGQVALVTGASQGIGRAIADALGRAGATTIINGRDPDRLRTPVDEMRAAGANAFVAAFDTTDEDAVRGSIDAVVDEHGQLDILVNNAGVMRKLDVFGTSLDDWNAVLGVNLTGPFLCSKAALRHMKDRGSGRIVMISSTAGQRGSPSGVVSYSAAKAGVIGLAQVLAYTAAKFGVTVNAIAPGMIETDMLRAGFGDDLSEAAKGVPLGLGTPEDIAEAVLYLASPAGRYVTGATLDVNGGLYIR